LTVEHVAAQIALHVDAELVLRHKGEGVGVEITGEEILLFDAVRNIEPEGLSSRARPLELDARAPCLAAGAFLPVLLRPNEFQRSQGDSGGAEIALLTIGSLGIGIAEAVAAQRAPAARARGGFVKTRERLAEQDELDEIEQHAFP